MPGRLIALLLFVATSAAPCLADPPAGARQITRLQYIDDGDPAHVLDLYVPENQGEKAWPLIIWVHGGAWRAGDRLNGSANQMATHGYAVACIEYRFSQKALFPAQIQDCQAAVRWLRANAKKYQLDPDHFGVWGNSAGGHLAALLGTTGTTPDGNVHGGSGARAFPPIGGNEDQSDRVQAVCDCYGPTDFTTVIEQAAKEPVKNIFKFNTPTDPYSGLTGAPLADDPITRAVSPVHYITADDPPFLILHGTADPLVPLAQSIEFDAALRKAGVSSVLQKIPGAGHGGPEFRQLIVRKLVLCFFDKYLRGTKVKIDPLPESIFTAQGPATQPQ